MAKGAAKTGMGPTSVVAMEQYFSKEKRILSDEFAYGMLSTGMKMFVSLMQFPSLLNWMISTSESAMPGVWGGMLIRKRFIDEMLMESMNHIDAIVNLGAGFDTRAFRIGNIKNIPIWELDQPDNIQKKNFLIKKAFSALSANLNLVQIDFDKEEIASVLGNSGYQNHMKTFFIWEGVTQYLSKEGIASTFEFLSKVASGSRLAFTYVLRDFIEGKAMHDWERGYEKYVLTDKVWLWGMNPQEWPAYLNQYGWRIIEDKDACELAGEYITPTGRPLFTTSIERMVLAEKI